MKSAAEIALSDTVNDNNRKRDVYNRKSKPFILAQEVHTLPAVHTLGQEVLPTQAVWQKAQ